MIEAIIYSLGVTFFFRIIYFAIGEPHEYFNPKAIFSSYVNWLVERRNKKLGYALSKHKIEGGVIDLCEKRNDIKILRLQQLKPTFTYEYALGVCPNCTFVWVSIIFIFIPLLSMGLLWAWFFAVTCNMINFLLIKYL